jgi:WD40 repeat protein
MDGTLIWDTSSGDVVVRLPVSATVGEEKHHTAQVECLCWAYSGSILFTGSKDNTVRAWDAANNYSFCEVLTSHKAPVLCATYCPETQMLATSGRDSTVKIWNVSSLNPSSREKSRADPSIRCQIVSSMDGHRGDVCTLTWSHSGRALLSGARDNTLKLWDCETYEELREITSANPHDADIRRLIFVPCEGGREILMSCALDGKIKTWRLANTQTMHITMDEAQQRAETQLAEETALAAIMMGEGTLAILDDVKVDDRMMQTFAAHDNNVWDMKLRPGKTRDGRLVLATASSFNEIKFWSFHLHTKDEDTLFDLGSPFQDYVGHGGPVTSCCLFDNDRRMVSASEDYHVYMYDTDTTRVLAHWDYNGSVYRIAVDPKEKYVYAGGTAYTIRGYSLEPPYLPVVELEGHAGKVVSLAITNDGSLLASGAHDFNINLWPIKTQYSRSLDEGPEIIQPLATVVAHLGHVVDLQFAQGAPYLASCSNDHQVKCWKVSGRGIKEEWSAEEAHSTVVTSICWGRVDTKNMVYSGGWDGHVNVWDNARCMATLSAHTKRVYEVMCSENGDLLMSAGADLHCYVWSAVAPYDCLSVYCPEERGGMFSTLSVGKSLVLTGEWDGMLRVWPLFKSEGSDSYFEPYAKKPPRRVMMGPAKRPVVEKQATRNGGEEKTAVLDRQAVAPSAAAPQQQHGQRQQQQQPQPGGAPMFVSVTCPKNAQPGAILNVQHGQVTYQVQVPQGVAPGGTFQFQIAAP